MTQVEALAKYAARYFLPENQQTIKRNQSVSFSVTCQSFSKMATGAVGMLRSVSLSRRGLKGS
jgi:hypothetical protein